MPRNEDQVYSLPAGTEAVTGTTIESAKYNMVLNDLEAEMNAPRPIASGGTGVTSIAGLQGLVGYSADNLAALTAGDAAYPVGATVHSRQDGTSYRVVAAGGQHVTAGGVHLIEAGPAFTTRARLSAAIAAGILTQGQSVTVGGTGYVIDATATGAASALADISRDGVRALLPGDNTFLSAHFTNQTDYRVNFGTSLDGVNFAALNGDVLPGGATWTIAQRDPAVTFFNGEWWLFGTGGAEGSHDFVAYRGPSLTALTKYQYAMAGGPYYSTTVPMSGSATPASAIWAPQPFVNGGKLYVFLSIRYGADLVDAFGNTVQRMRTYRTELNAAGTGFTAPVAVAFDDTRSLIDASVARDGSTFVVAVKDDAAKNIRIYSGPALAGPWTFHRVVSDTAYSIEAPCLVRVLRKTLGGGEYNRWRIYLDNNRTGPTNPTPNILVGAPLYVESLTSDPTGEYGPLTPVHFGRPVRHGSVVNLADLPPEARQSLLPIAAARTVPRPALLASEVISGVTTIRPQPDVTYYVEGAGSDSVLTILDGPADRFYLACFAADTSTGITVAASARVSVGFLLGYGRGNDTVIEMRRRDRDGRYYPVGQVRRAEFLAHKNGANQAVAGATDVMLTWPTEVYDRGGYFAAHRWTPPKGLVDVTVHVLMSGIQDGENNRVNILKNGGIVRTAFAPGVTGSQVTLVARLTGDSASGSDYYEAQVRGNGAGGKTISGLSLDTFFHGVAV